MASADATDASDGTCVSSASAGGTVESPPSSLDDALLLSLFCEWYGTHGVTAVHFAKFNEYTFTALWTGLWFAKGALQAVVDERLRCSYGGLFDALPRPAPGTAPPAPPAHIAGSGPASLMWRIGLLVLCDQVTRNIFRGTARAYEYDAWGRALAAALLPDWDRLPVPVRASVVLAYVHSEDVADVAVVESLLGRLRGPLEALSPSVWTSLSGIARNHRDRMHSFGRIPERNAFLGRESTEAELAYIAYVGRS